MTTVKEQITAPAKELSHEEVDNLSDAEIKTLVIRMLTELTELSQKMQAEMKTTQSEIKQNIQETNSEGKETRTQIDDLERKEEVNIHMEHDEETRIRTHEERHRNLLDNFKLSDIQIIGGPEGDKEEQDVENLFEQIMKENFPNLKIDSRMSRKPRESQGNWTQAETH